MSTKRISPDTVVVDLTVDSEPEEERRKELNSLRKKFKRNNRRVKSEPEDIKSTRLRSVRARRIKRERPDTDEENDDSKATSDDDCAVVEAPAKKIRKKTSTTTSKDDDDIELVGTANETKLPHMRQHCTEFPFGSNNHQCCDLCYCYVCDEKAEDCGKWKGNHCNATDAGKNAKKWKTMRAKAAKIKAGDEDERSPSPLRALPDSDSEEERFWRARLESDEEDMLNLLATPSMAITSSTNRNTRLKGRTVKAGPGPFPPSDTVAAVDPNLTACRQCGYFNRFFHRNFKAYRNLHPVGFLDWCQFCGVVASEQDFEKVQSPDYEPQANEEEPEKTDVYLGSKTMAFSIFHHDPRQIKAYKKNWSKSGLSYNEKELQHDVFRHRLGAKPNLKLLLASIPVSNNANPKKASTVGKVQPAKYDKYYQSTYSRNENESYERLCCQGGDKFTYWKGQGGHSAVSMDEVEGIQLENPETDLMILSELYQFETQGLCNVQDPKAPKILVGYDLAAKWDKQAKKGTLTVKVYIRPNKISASRDFASFSKLLGAWYGIFPFKLSDISGSLKAVACTTNAEHVVVHSTIAAGKIQKAVDKIQDQADKAIEEYNAVATTRREEQTLAASHDGLGGTCGGPPASGLESVLKGFFSQVLVDDIVKGRINGKRWIDQPFGLVASHRRLSKGGTHLEDADCYDGDCIHELNYIAREDVPVAVVNMREDCKTIWKGTKCLKGIVDHCENVGHAKVPFFEGLNVELLQFQKESVQWALERELCEGGIQSMLWAKLPQVAEPNTELYFNPIIEAVRRDKPKLCRGGIIAEEMGLGKTVISLALILCNPAPALPDSGTLATNLDKLEDTGKGWDKKLYSTASAINKNLKKRGRIISRGTLVVCKVSLVGQWVAEAKSKLADPGLVYSYHGSNRKRDPKILAKNAIVVTTYETLMSDDNFWKEKSGKSDYCAPIEQIRWWRIICDESHEMGNTNARKTQSTMNLHSDHRWLVSGTPIVSSVEDLRNQMKFIGIEFVDEMFNTLTKLKAHMRDPAARKKKNPNGRVLGHFMYLLRSLLMRHSQKQTYRGTDTTLMSLPPKTERVVEIEFDETEREEYKDRETEALEFYSRIRASALVSKKKKMGKSYLKLKQRLKPLQIACAGGPTPIDEETPTPNEKDKNGDQKMKDVEEEEEDEDDDESEEEEEEEDVSGKKKKRVRAKKEQQYSDFAFSSKCKRLIQELKESRDKDETSKSLVFSQFASSLKYLQEELPKHGFSFRTLSGDMSMKKRAKALDDFQNDPPTTIFLLSMRAAAVGINLTQANRVYLLEPSFNPAMVRQAIGRVYRLGQKRSVEIIRLVVKDSVETRITKLVADKQAEGDANADDSDLVGSIKEDKTEILIEEFDSLFGYEPPPIEETNKQWTGEEAAPPGEVKKERSSSVKTEMPGRGDDSDSEGDGRDGCTIM